MTKDKICTICEIPIEVNFCSRCGQKISEKPTSIISLITDFVSNFFSLEKSGFATMFKILVKPKPIVNNYYLGFKNYYASPGKLLLYGIAIVALHITFVNDKLMGLSLNAENINAQYLFWLIMFPFLLFCSFLTFIRAEKHLSKHLISLIYVASSLFVVLTILNDIIILIFGDKLGLWAFITFISLTFFWNSRVLTTKQNYAYIILNTLIQIAIFIGVIFLLILVTNQLQSE